MLFGIVEGGRKLSISTNCCLHVEMRFMAGHGGELGAGTLSNSKYAKVLSAQLKWYSARIQKADCIALSQHRADKFPSV